MSLADTNNNPGNIRDTSWSRNLPGYVGANKGFAVFDSPSSGFAGQVQLLRNYLNKGYNTIASIVSRYAPSSENDTNSYINNISKWTGLDPNTVLGTDQLDKVASAMARMEGYTNWKGLPNAPSNSGDTANPSSSSSSVLGGIANTITPKWLTDLISGHTAARWVSVIIGIILIGLAVAAFTLTSDSGKQIINAVK